MPRLWIKEMKNHKVIRQYETPCVWGAHHDALEEALNKLDLPNPMWLSKHENEFERFRRTVFLPEHFIESVKLDRLEVEYLDDEEKKHVSKDPRNQF